MHCTDLHTHPHVVFQKKFVAAFRAGDKDVLRNLVHHDFELQEGPGMPLTGTYHGVESFITFLDIFLETFEIQRFESTEVYAFTNLNRTAFLFELNAIYRRAGTPFNSSVLGIWDFMDEKILRISTQYSRPLIRV